MAHRFTSRATRWMPATIVVGAALALSACGGTSPGATTSGNQVQTTTAVTTDALPTTGSAATTQPAGGGGLTTADDFCLNTPEEVSAALGIGTVTAAGSASPGLGGGCLYTDSTGAVVYATSVVLGSAAPQTFQAFKASEGVEEVQGIGDGAIYLRVNELLGIAFLKGEVLASMSPSAGLAIHDDEAALRSALADLGRQAAGRA